MKCCPRSKTNWGIIMFRKTLWENTSTNTWERSMIEGAKRGRSPGTKELKARAYSKIRRGGESETEALAVTLRIRPTRHSKKWSDSRQSLQRGGNPKRKCRKKGARTITSSRGRSRTPTLTPNRRRSPISQNTKNERKAAPVIQTDTVCSIR